MEPPVGLHGPAVLFAVGDLLQEVLLGVRFALVLLQRLPQVAYVLGSAQFRDARQQHEGEEGDEQVGVGAEGEVGLSAGVLIGSGRRRHMIGVKEKKTKVSDKFTLKVDCLSSCRPATRGQHCSEKNRD